MVCGVWASEEGQKGVCGQHIKEWLALTIRWKENSKASRWWKLSPTGMVGSHHGNCGAKIRRQWKGCSFTCGTVGSDHCTKIEHQKTQVVTVFTNRQENRNGRIRSFDGRLAEKIKEVGRGRCIPFRFRLHRRIRL